jgi:hypothetical protein
MTANVGAFTGPLKCAASHAHNAGWSLKCGPAALGALLLLAAFSALAQESRLAGDWTGTVDVRDARRRLVLHVIRRDDGTLKGTLDSPAEGVQGAVLDEIRLDLSLVQFRCKAVGASYSGRLNGDVITGTLKQRGFAMKLVFERSVAELPPVPRSPKTSSRVNRDGRAEAPVEGSPFLGWVRRQTGLEIWL